MCFNILFSTIEVETKNRQPFKITCFQVITSPKIAFQAVSAAVLDPQLKHLNLREHLLTAEEETNIEEILRILNPMKIATTFVCGEKQPTASKILPTLAKLRTEMAVHEEVDSDLVTQMKMNIVDNLNRRYTDNNISSFFDPRYKSLNNIAKEGAVFVTKQAIRKMCLKVAEKQSIVGGPVDSEKEPPPHTLASSANVKAEIPSKSLDTSIQSGEPSKKRLKVESEDYDDWLSDVIYVGSESGKQQTSNSELINQELEKYDGELQIKGDPLEWWKGRKGSMPILSEVARAVLCVPGSSVPSERVFSKSGHLLNKKRASLKGKNVKMLLFLNKNYSYIQSRKQTLRKKTITK